MGTMEILKQKWPFPQVRFNFLFFFFIFYFLFFIFIFFYFLFFFLFFRSGIPHDQLKELHGNIYLEKCEKCKAEYFRKFNVMGSGRQHLTGRKCEKENCDGFLIDSIIHFGENLPEKEITSSIDHSNMCDLALVLGTSMRVKKNFFFIHFFV
jgi:NAD-dependent SIR2 family protein deacetylase